MRDERIILGRGGRLAKFWEQQKGHESFRQYAHLQRHLVYFEALNVFPLENTSGELYDMQFVDAIVDTVDSLGPMRMLTGQQSR